MDDSMTFRARRKEVQCELCSAHPAVFEFDIQCDEEKSRQKGSCCTLCARNLLDALAQIRPDGLATIKPKPAKKRKFPPNRFFLRIAPLLRHP